MNPEYRFDSSHLEWIHYEGGPRFDYHIDYKLAVLGYQEDSGLLDLMIKWAPNSYCHFHRHIAATTTLVLQGEHHVVDLDEDGTETEHHVRPAGTYRHSTGGDLHMEYGGPEGATVLFAMYEPSGHMFDVLDNDHNVIGVSSITELARQADEHAAVDAD